ncbi:ABC transporter substrate-binding protein [Demequina lignilytica]|uniref:ABC transporter substrate-binding protein n=1 Tax=Demequina lignilytica TaxID=3051663 RepID=A0AB35MFQ6_9MICO|nr:ABC transporter substrate-binding protein [Demequina sp. SYSU T0a273]MDN4482606.1 ABC transporter substrate-binding protein [Demequina sp. SYSU T0a273]
MFRTAAVIACAAAGVLALAACSSGADAAVEVPAMPAASGGSDAHAALLRLGMVDAPGEAGFVASQMAFATKSVYGQAVYDTLVRATAANKLEAGLATGWEYDETSTVLTMRLRTDVRFSDGAPFTADAAVQNLLRFRDGGSQNAYWLASVADVVALDESTIQLTLSSPDPVLLLQLSRSAGYMESPASFEDPAPVGTGPYLLDAEASVADETYVYVANPEYWAPEFQHYDRIEMSVFEEPEPLMAAFLENRLDAGLYNGYYGFEQIEGAGYTANDFMLDWTGLLLYDRAGEVNPALADVNVRRAINFAFDREGMLATLNGGRGEVTTQIFGIHTDGYNGALDTVYDYNPEKARDLLVKAGYPEGFELEMPSVSWIPAAVFESMAAQLADIGITVVYTDEPDYIAAITQPRYAAVSFQLEQPATPWETYVNALFPGVAEAGVGPAPWNPFGSTDPFIERIVAKFQAGDPGAAKELNNYMVDQAWFAPFYRNLSVFYTGGSTAATLQVGNAYPALWNIVPTGA